MEGSWEGLLDIIGLNQNIRQKANLKVLIVFPLGDPKTDLLLNLFEYIKKIYGSEKCTILWWYGEPYPYTKIISKDDLKFLQNLWDTIAGHYILFLPEDFDVDKIGVEDEEEFIGMSLVTHCQLLLKTPDGNEILYLNLNEDNA
jgi:hypothetical protein